MKSTDTKFTKYSTKCQLFIIVSASFCNIDESVQIFLWCQQEQNYNWLKRYICLENGIPSLSTIRSIKEEKIMDYLIQGYTNDEIAQNLCVTEATVKTHLRNIYSKFGTRSKNDTVALKLYSDFYSSLNSYNGFIKERP